MKDVSDSCNQPCSSSGTQCRLNGLHHINPNSWQLSSRISLHITFGVQPKTLNRNCDRLPRGPKVRTTEMSGAVAGEATEKAVASWCQKHPGYIVINGSSDYRSRCASLSTFSVHDYGQVLMQESEGLCMTAALTNAVWCLCGREDAVSVKSKLFENVLVSGSVASMSEEAQRLGLHLELRTCRYKLARSFLSLSLIPDFVFLVCFFCRSLLDHIICEDTKGGINVDSCERYPLVLTQESLIDCTGNDNSNFRIGEI